MIKSMTGFGKATGEVNGSGYSVEIRSLNGKQLDLNLRLSYLWRPFEMEIRNWATENIKRGKVDIYINTVGSNVDKKATINQELAKRYAAEISLLAADINASGYDILGQVLKMPEVLQQTADEADEQQFKLLFNLIKKAFESFDEYRGEEGQKTCDDLTANLSVIENALEKIIELDETRLSKVKQRLYKALEDNNLNDLFDPNRLEQELIYYLEKLDINEEKIRLKSHLAYAHKTIESEENQGKKLGFICQEIGREINTIGSKCNDAEMQKLVVLMKDSLEKIKEQVLNIL
jgi:uncharacterized protein (TIGR00255 family)